MIIIIYFQSFIALKIVMEHDKSFFLISQEYHLSNLSLCCLSSCSGQRKVSLLFCLLHLLVALWRTVTGYPSVWLASICLSLASMIFFFNFETWMVVEHDKVCLQNLFLLLLYDLLLHGGSTIVKTL